MLGVDLKNEGIMRSYTGHGMIEKHPAGLTIAGVMGHELGHINGARSLALASGASVVSENIELTVEFEGSRLVASGGKATTVTARSASPASSYKKVMDGFELEKKINLNPSRPIKNAAQLREAGAPDKYGPNEDDKAPDAKVNELSAFLSQQKQKLESRLQQLSMMELGAVEEAAVAGVESRQADAAGGRRAAPAAAAAASTDAVARRQAAAKLERVKEQIAKIDNIIASLKVVKSVKTLDGILQAVAGVGLLIGSAEYASSASAATLPSTTAPVRSERKTAMEAMISMLEDSLRGMVVNLSV